MFIVEMNHQRRGFFFSPPVFFFFTKTLHSGTRMLTSLITRKFQIVCISKVQYGAQDVPIPIGLLTREFITKKKKGHLTSPSCQGGKRPGISNNATLRPRSK